MDAGNAIQRNPRYRQAFVLRADAYRKLGKEKEAAADAEMVRRLNEDEAFGK
ncbi:MAG: hypothetical protein K8T91_23115 [Planctomycetes bacterium]|nr:hypothetical protein [Planctomycetota bacterium]